MGAGRSFVLLAALALAAVPAAAEAPALAVSPYDALSQGAGVELRDAHNRPVSRQGLARALKAGAEAETAPTATQVGRALTEFLERLSAPAQAVRGEASAVARHGELSAGAPREPKARVASCAGVSPAVNAASRRAARSETAPATLFGRAFNLPLRI